ncbi:MAG: recombinase family protein [Myxococcota bacterium]
MTGPQLRAALYARVSSNEQHVDAQLTQLREYSSRQGWSAQEFVDEGQSGAKARRPALDAMVAAVHKRQIDALVITKLDRLGRSVSHLCDVASKLRAAGVRLVVLDQGVDTETATGELLFHVLGAVAQFERSLIVERTRAGLAAARRRGKRLGRRPVLDQRGRERAQRLARAGRSVREVAKLLEVSVGAAHAAMRSSVDGAA